MKCKKNFGRKTYGKKVHMEGLGEDKRIILKLLLEKQIIRLSSGINGSG
jgi:hypothetical protein